MDTVTIEYLNSILIEKFLEFEKLVPDKEISEDLYQCGRYDAFDEISDILYELSKK